MVVQVSLVKINLYNRTLPVFSKHYSTDVYTMYYIVLIVSFEWVWNVEIDGR